MRPVDLRRRAWIGAVLGALVLLGAGAALLAVAASAGVAPGVLVRDVNAVAQLPVYTGMLSQAGLVLWAAAAGAGLLGGLVLRDRPLSETGLLSVVLCLDDTFQLHEAALARWLPERVVLAALGALVLVWAVRDGRRLLRSTWSPVLLLAVGLLGASVGVDLLGSTDDVPQAAEDLLKLVGVVGWLAFTCLHAADGLRTAIGTSAGPATGRPTG